MRAIIGHSGYVGATLTRQTDFDAFFRSKNISTIRDRTFDLVICAGAPGQKWLANREPVADRKAIDCLISHLETIKCDKFVLISTADIFKRPVSVDEESAIDEDGLHPYGLHRHLLEKFAESRFEEHLVIRLPALVGPGLRKNVIFDLLNENNLAAIDSRSVFQFYPMVNLWCDIQIALRHGLKIVHLTAEPCSVSEISGLAFNKPFDHLLPNPPAAYDMRTCYAALFGGTGHYQYSRRESLLAVRAYAQSEPRTLKAQE